MAEPLRVVVDEPDNSTRVDPVTGTVEVDLPDGGVVVQISDHPPTAANDDDAEHFENLVDKIDGGTLQTIGEELYEQIIADDVSRKGKLDDIQRGLDMLGLQLKKPRSDVSDSSAPLEGMSVVDNPLLLEACLKGWANSQAELLPASGPCKIENIATLETDADRELAEAFERDMNAYLTVGAPEWVPDTSAMLLWGTYFAGAGIKKVYRCPLRRRPVSDSVDIADLIVSDTTKDFRACERITHQSKMRPSVVKRMRLIGEYTDSVTLQQPTPETNPVENRVAQIQGVSPNNNRRPEEQPYTVWETQCELNLEFGPAKFRDENIPLPYRVVMDKDSRQIWSVRRDWNPDDEECMRKRLYVKYPYVPGPGFYGTGLLNILGNSTAAMTAAWRETLDAGMFANFPAGLIAKLGNRQLTTDMRLAPTALKPIDTNGMPIQSVVMALPYKDVTPGLLSLMDKITAQAKEVGGTADIPVGEGLQNIPVGTMLANIEQATKIMAAAHKGMHTAQSEELQMLAELFRESPEDFWRSLRENKEYWDEQKLLLALSKHTLVPKSDPNVPSHIHRIMKALALVNLIQVPQFTPLLSAEEALKRILAVIKEDPTGLMVKPQPQEGPRDLTGEAKMLDANTKAKKLSLDAATKLQDTANKAAENESKERVAGMHLASELLIHGDEMRAAGNSHAIDVANHLLEQKDVAHQQAMDVAGLMQPPEPKP